MSQLVCLAAPVPHPSCAWICVARLYTCSPLFYLFFTGCDSTRVTDLGRSQRFSRIMSAPAETVLTTTADEPKIEAPAAEPTPEVKAEVRHRLVSPQRLTDPHPYLSFRHPPLSLPRRLPQHPSLLPQSPPLRPLYVSPSRIPLASIMIVFFSLIRRQCECY